MAIVDYEAALTRLEKNMLSNEQMVKDQYMAQNSYKYSDDVDLEGVRGSEHYVSWVIDLAHNLQRQGKH